MKARWRHPEGRGLQPPQLVVHAFPGLHQCVVARDVQARLGRVLRQRGGGGVHSVNCNASRIGTRAATPLSPMADMAGHRTLPARYGVYAALPPPVPPPISSLPVTVATAHSRGRRP